MKLLSKQLFESSNLRYLSQLMNSTMLTCMYFSLIYQDEFLVLVLCKDDKIMQDDSQLFLTSNFIYQFIKSQIQWANFYLLRLLQQQLVDRTNSVLLQQCISFRLKFSCNSIYLYFYLNYYVQVQVIRQVLLTNFNASCFRFLRCNFHSKTKKSEIWNLVLKFSFSFYLMIGSLLFYFLPLI